MNKRQKIVQEQFLNNEEAIIRKLKNLYSHAEKEIAQKAQALQDDINRLGALADLAEDDEEKAKILSMQQSLSLTMLQSLPVTTTSLLTSVEFISAKVDL